MGVEDTKSAIKKAIESGADVYDPSSIWCVYFFSDTNSYGFSCPDGCCNESFNSFEELWDSCNTYFDKGFRVDP